MKSVKLKTSLTILSLAAISGVAHADNAAPTIVPIYNNSNTLYFQTSTEAQYTNTKNPTFQCSDISGQGPAVTNYFTIDKECTLHYHANSSPTTNLPKFIPNNTTKIFNVAYTDLNNPSATGSQQITVHIKDINPLKFDASNNFNINLFQSDTNTPHSDSDCGYGSKDDLPDSNHGVARAFATLSPYFGNTDIPRLDIQWGDAVYHSQFQCGNASWVADTSSQSYFYDTNGTPHAHIVFNSFGSHANNTYQKSSGKQWGYFEDGLDNNHNDKMILDFTLKSEDGTIASVVQLPDESAPYFSGFGGWYGAMEENWYEGLPTSNGVKWRRNVYFWKDPLLNDNQQAGYVKNAPNLNFGNCPSGIYQQYVTAKGWSPTDLPENP